MRNKALNIICDQDEGVDLNALGNAVYGVLAQTDNLSCEVEFVDEAEIADLNLRLRNVEGVTDVLSFPSLDGIRGKQLKCSDYPLDCEDGELFLGSIAVCLKRAEEQAVEYGHSRRRELTYLICHGLLHLFGYDHITDEDKAQMRELEEKIMTQIGVTRGQA